MCGENARITAVDKLADGSSPRVRGKPHARRVGRGLPGLIPACAGKTSAGRARARPCPAHPRVCGENVEGPPSLRTKLRLIPACAGKTSKNPGTPLGGGAHPRVCGENSPKTRVPGPSRGSSPRVRGKPGAALDDGGAHGLIPACAGKTWRRWSSRSVPRAHPRVCGENWSWKHAGKTLPGSSPRVRGKLARALGVRQTTRLIPACAGKTKLACVSSATGSAHPRVCGENHTITWTVDAMIGSSPRVRGKRVR